MKIFLNGNIVEEEGATVSAISSGIYYGAGCFESFLSYSSTFLHFDEHIARLHSGLRYIGLSDEQLPEEENLRKHILDVLKANKLTDKQARVRIQTSLNEKAGYSKTVNPDFDTLITVKPHQTEKKPKRICSVQTKVIPNQCRPAHCKLSNMLHYRNAFREAEHKGFDDALMLTVDDFISETSIANIFWKKGSVIYTPDESCDVLPGVMRNIVLNILEDSEKFQVKKGRFRLDEIKSADEVFITNSVREISFVQNLDETEFKTNSSFSESIQKSLENYKLNHLATTFNTLQDVYSWLDSIPMFGNVGAAAADFSLDSISEFCAMMGNPQEKFPAIHVAGTNGKGTTCQMLASVYQSAGYKTGLYTSPHLLDYRDRFKIDANSISESDLVLFFQTFEDEILKKELTYFELSTAIAFWYFNYQKVDIAIIETGLGGRLDATNIINPLVSVITSIGLDHTDILGDTVEQIAAEKAGIIKPKTPVVIGDLSSEAESVVTTFAMKQDSEKLSIDELYPRYTSQEIVLQTADEILKIDSKDRSKIDAVNCAMAYQAVKLSKKRFPIENKTFKKGIEMMSVRFPIHAHFERLDKNMDWYFDGGHNLQSITAMVQQLQEIAPLDQWTLVLSVMKDKLTPELAILLRGFKKVYLHPQKSVRGAKIDQMKDFFPNAAELQAEEHLPEDWLEKHKSELVIFGGSFYFYSIVRRWMGAIAT